MVQPAIDPPPRAPAAAAINYMRAKSPHRMVAPTSRGPRGSTRTEAGRLWKRQARLLQAYASAARRDSDEQITSGTKGSLKEAASRQESASARRRSFPRGPGCIRDTTDDDEEEQGCKTGWRVQGSLRMRSIGSRSHSSESSSCRTETSSRKIEVLARCCGQRLAAKEANWRRDDYGVLGHRSALCEAPTSSSAHATSCVARRSNRDATSVGHGRSSWRPLLGDRGGIIKSSALWDHGNGTHRRETVVTLMAAPRAESRCESFYQRPSKRCGVSKWWDTEVCSVQVQERIRSGRHGKQSSFRVLRPQSRHLDFFTALFVLLLLGVFGEFAQWRVLPVVQAKGITITFGNRWRTSAADVVKPPSDDDDEHGNHRRLDSEASTMLPDTDGNEVRTVEVVALDASDQQVLGTRDVGAMSSYTTSSQSTSVVAVSPPAVSQSFPTLAMRMRQQRQQGGADGLGGVRISTTPDTEEQPSSTLNPLEAWRSAWTATVKWVSDGVRDGMVRPVRKSMARTTGLRGFFSRKGFYRFDLPPDPRLLRSKLEIIAFSRLLDGIETAVRPTWVRAVNKVLMDQTVPRVSCRETTSNFLFLPLQNIAHFLIS